MIRLIILLLMSSEVAWAQTYLVTFSSNVLSESGGATKSDMSGTDLYTAYYQPGRNDTVWGIRRITSYEGKAEIFASLSPDTNWIAYNYNQRYPWFNQIRLIQRSTNKEYTLVNTGRFPEWIGNERLIYSDSADIYLSTLQLSAATPGILNIKKITNRTLTPNIKQCEDPFPYDGGKKILFHGYSSSSGATAICKIDTTGQNFTVLSPFNAYGHVIAPNAVDVLGSQAPSQSLLKFKSTGFNGTGTAINLPTSGVILKNYDVRYAACSEIKWMFPAMGYSSTSFFATAVGQDADGTNLVSKIFYVEYDAGWNQYAIHDFSKKIEKALNVTNKDFITCSSRSFDLKTTPIKEFNKPFSFTIYPNPAVGSCTVFTDSSVDLNIYTVSGIHVRHSLLLEGTNVVNLEGLPASTYIVQAGQVFKKLQIVH